VSAIPRHWWGALLHPWTWRMAWRDSRSQRKRLLLFSLSIVAGIGALVAVHSLRESLQEGVRTQAKALLGSDLHIASREPFDPEIEAKIVSRAVAVTRETEFSSMLYFPGVDGTRMVSVRGLDGGFPYYGKIETVPADAWQRMQSEDGVVLERALLDQFAVKVGDRVKLGALTLPILGSIEKTPPKTSKFGGFAPECYLRREALVATDLLGASKIAFNHLHLKLAEAKTARAIQKEFADPHWRYETPANRRDALGNALDNVEEFLGLIAITSLVLGAIGVAGAIHAHVSRRVAAVAILRCLGCPGDAAFAIYLVQAMMLGAVAALIGAAFGVVLHWGIVTHYRDVLPFALNPAASWSVVARTTAGGLVVCGVFALLPLLRVRQIAPGAALKDNAAPILSRRLWPLYIVLALILAGLAVLGQTHRWRALAMAGGLALTFAILAAIAHGLTVAARKLVRPGWPYLVRQGISNLYRPHNQTLLFLLSLGLGTFLLLTVLQARDALLQKLDLKTFAESPSLYLIDVQPDQVEGVAALVRAQQLPVLETAPMVTMRIESIRGTPVKELSRQATIPKWVLEREYRSSYRAQLGATEKLVAGEWFKGPFDGNGPTPISLEKEIAKDLHVGLGDEMVLDVQGVPVTARVTNLREVDWSKMNLNFFMIFPPGVLESAPGFNVITARLPTGVSSGGLQRALVKGFPNVTAIDLSLILDTVRNILEKAARIISILAGFTMLAGLPILAATLLNGRDQRVRESVLLRTLGASARQVRVILLVEYATLGVLSALAGVVLSVVASWALAKFVFKIEPTPDATLLAGAFGCAVALAVVGGLALSRGVTRHPPLAVLRGAG
jgi:putative ABC transport system permease protein